MKKFILLLVFVFSTGFIEGQTTFFKTISSYDNSSNYIEQTTDGGYILAGKNLHPTGLNAYVVKTNSIGDTVWTKVYGTVAEFFSGKQTIDGGYVFLGKERNSITADEDIFVLKIDPLGNIQWQKTIAGPGSTEGRCIKQTQDGGYIIAGYGWGTSDIDMCIIKLDSLGNFLWHYLLGTPDHERAYDVEETNDGGLVIIGESYSISSGSSIYLLKLNSTGILQWSKSYGGSGYELGRNIIQTSDNGYLVLGNRRDTIASSDDMCIIKTDSLGNVLWSNTYKGAVGHAVRSIKKTSEGNFIISSSIDNSIPSGTNLLYTLITPTGSEIWSRFMGKNDTINFMTSSGTYAQQTTDGGYIFTGYSSTPGPGGFIYLIKADSTGNSGCDSTTSLIINTYTPAVSIPSLSSLTVLINSLYTTPSSSRSDTITTYCTSVGINELPSTPQISVYPNPSSGQFNFSGVEKESKIEVFDITGRIIYQSIANGDFEMINISDKAKGIYFYRITKEMKLVQNGKVCLQ